MAILAGVINGGKFVQDYELSAGISTLLDEGIRSGTLGMSFDEIEGVLTINPGVIFKKVKRTGDANEFIVDIHNTQILTLDAQIGRFIYVVANKAIIDNPTLMTPIGDNVFDIVVGDTPPSGSLILAQIVAGEGENPATVEILTNINKSLSKEINTSFSSGSPYFGTTSGSSTDFVINYPTPVIALGNTPDTIGTGELYMRLDRNNFGVMFITINTTQGLLTAELKKNGNISIQGGDFMVGQIISFIRDKQSGTFQLMSGANSGGGGGGGGNFLSMKGIANEYIESGDVVFFGQSITTEETLNTITSSDNHSIRSSGEYLRVDLTTFNNPFLKTIFLRALNTGTPTDSLQIIFRKKSTNTVVGVSNQFRVSSTTEQEYQVDCNLMLEPRTYYYMEIYRTGSTDTTNYYNIRKANDWRRNFCGRAYSTSDGVSFSGSGLVWFNAQFESDSNSDKGFFKSKRNRDRNQADGIAQTSGEKGDIIDIAFAGAVSNTPKGNLSLIDIAEGYTRTLFGQEMAFGYRLDDREQLSQPFSLGINENIYAIILNLAKVGNPQDNLIVRIETDNNGVPSGELVNPIATFTMSMKDLRLQYRRQYIYFGGSFKLERITNYHIVLKRSGETDTANYAKISGSTTTPRILSLTRENGSWVNTTQQQNFTIIGEKNNIIYSNNNSFQGQAELVFNYLGDDRDKLMQTFIYDSDVQFKFLYLPLKRTGTPLNTCRVSLQTIERHGTDQSINLQYWSNNQDYVFGNVDSQKRIGQQFLCDYSFTTKSVTIVYRVTGTPTARIKCTVYQDNAGIPGDLIGTGYINTAVSISGGANNRAYTAQFNSPVSFVSGNTYRLVVEANGPSSANYYTLRTQNSRQRGDFKIFDATTGKWGSTLASTICYCFGGVDNGMERAPSGNLVQTGAEAFISYQDLPTAIEGFTVEFPEIINIKKGVPFAIVLEGSQQNGNSGVYFSTLVFNSENLSSITEVKPMFGNFCGMVKGTRKSDNNQNNQLVCFPIINQQIPQLLGDFGVQTNEQIIKNLSVLKGLGDYSLINIERYSGEIPVPGTTNTYLGPLLSPFASSNWGTQEVIRRYKRGWSGVFSFISTGDTYYGNAYLKVLLNGITVVDWSDRRTGMNRTDNISIKEGDIVEISQKVSPASAGSIQYQTIIQYNTVSSNSPIAL